MLAARLTAQLLAGPPARDPVAVAERILAVQGQDPRGFRLAVRARTEGLTAADVDRALTEERSLLVTWLNRGTLHLVRSEDYPLLQAVTTPPLRTSSERRLAQEGVRRRGARHRAIERALADEGPLTSDALRERLVAAGVRAEGQALYHLLFKASLDGLVVRGPMAGQAGLRARARLARPSRSRVDRDEALGEFARRYLAGHGPATDRDLARWAGIPLGDAAGRPRGGGRAALLRSVPSSRRRGCSARSSPCLLGWISREDIVGDEPNLVTAGGMFYPFAMVRGRAVASWRLADGEVELDPFRRIAKADREALERDAEDVVRFLG